MNNTMVMAVEIDNWVNFFIMAWFVGKLDTVIEDVEFCIKLKDWLSL